MYEVATKCHEELPFRITTLIIARAQSWSLLLNFFAFLFSVWLSTYTLFLPDLLDCIWCMGIVFGTMLICTHYRIGTRSLCRCST